MCRSIKRLHNAGEPATEAELCEAALQFVRKISGFRQPSRVNQPAFDAAVQEVAMAAAKMLHSLAPRPAPRNTA